MSKDLRIRAVALLLCAAGITAAYQQRKTEDVMVEAAKHFLVSLDADQKAKVAMPFNDQKRMSWHYVPGPGYESAYKFPRPGLRYKEMNSSQRPLADALLSSGLSRAGFIKAATIMSLEDILRAAEQNPSGTRDPEGYHFSIFGEPSGSGAWSLHVEGHHISLSFTMKDGTLIASTPAFFGANPHEVREGPRAGLRVLGREDDLGRNLMKSLNAEQGKAAMLEGAAPRDIVTGYSLRAELEGSPQGLQASKMTPAQLTALRGLFAEYAQNAADDVAALRMRAFDETPRDRIFFAWAGSIEPGQGDYYRIQTPKFLIEYDNTQGRNNHSHTVFRDFHGDFGLDRLAIHHQLSHHPVAAAE